MILYLFINIALAPRPLCLHTVKSESFDDILSQIWPGVVFMYLLSALLHKDSFKCSSTSVICVLRTILSKDRFEKV